MSVMRDGRHKTGVSVESVVSSNLTPLHVLARMFADISNRRQAPTTVVSLTQRLKQDPSVLLDSRLIGIVVRPVSSQPALQ